MERNLGKNITLVTVVRYIDIHQGTFLIALALSILQVEAVRRHERRKFKYVELDS